MAIELLKLVRTFAPAKQCLRLPLNKGTVRAQMGGDVNVEGQGDPQVAPHGKQQAKWTELRQVLLEWCRDNLGNAVADKLPKEATLKCAAPSRAP